MEAMDMCCRAQVSPQDNRCGEKYAPTVAVQAAARANRAVCLLGWARAMAIPQQVQGRGHAAAELGVSL